MFKVNEVKRLFYEGDLPQLFVYISQEYLKQGKQRERERIIKELKANEHIWRERVVLNGLIALIKGENK